MPDRRRQTAKALDLAEDSHGAHKNTTDEKRNEPSPSGGRLIKRFCATGGRVLSECGMKMDGGVGRISQATG